MAITKLNRSKVGIRSFRYLFKESSETNKDRVLHYDTIGITPGSNEFMFSQFAKVWKRADKLNWIDKEGAVFGRDGGRAHDQAILTITSFSEEDFPKQPDGGYTDEQIMAAMDIVLETHREMGFPQVILVAQNDGDGGYLHIHGFANAVDPVTNRTLDKQYSYYNRFRAITDKVIQQFGLTPVESSKANVLTKEERDKRAGRIPKDTVLFDEVLKNKIYSVLDSGVQSRDDFVTRLAVEGVEVTITENENGTDGIKYVMFDDIGDKKRNRRRKGSKLGTDFMLDHIDEVIEVSKKSVFTREDERRLATLRSMRDSVPAGPFHDSMTAKYDEEIKELKAKRDGAKPKKVEPKKEQVIEPKREETAEPEIERRHVRKPEERKGRRPEDEVHEVPDVKPLNISVFDREVKKVTETPWIFEDEEEVEVAESAEQVAAPEPEPELTEAEKRKLEMVAKAKAKLRDALNANDNFYIPGGLPEKDDKAVEK